VVVNTTQRRGLTAASPVFFGTAPSAAEYSEASFIGMASASHSSCPWLRKDVTSPPTGWAAGGKAIAYVASVGYHELHVNGEKATDDVLSPSISDLAKRVLVRPYEITALLTPGQPYTLGLWLGPGWSQFGSRTRLQASNIFNTTKAPLVNAVVRFYAAADLHLLGSVLTDATWKVRLSPAEHIGEWQNGDFGGDRYNASMELEGWALPGTALDGSWEAATVYPSASSSSARVLSTDVAEPNRLRERVTPPPILAIPTPGNCSWGPIHIVSTGIPMENISWAQPDNIFLGGRNRACRSCPSLCAGMATSCWSRWSKSLWAGSRCGT
jgi:hypothetical protein